MPASFFIPWFCAIRHRPLPAAQRWSPLGGRWHFCLFLLLSCPMLLECACVPVPVRRCPLVCCLVLLPNQGIPLALSELPAVCMPSGHVRKAIVPASFFIPWFCATRHRPLPAAQRWSPLGGRWLFLSLCLQCDQPAVWRAGTLSSAKTSFRLTRELACRAGALSVCVGRGRLCWWLRASLVTQNVLLRDGNSPVAFSLGHPPLMVASLLCFISVAPLPLSSV